jgi:hypothetical protein
MGNQLGGQIGSQVLTDFSSVTGVGSFSQGDLTIKIPTKLTPEQYWLKISVFQDENILKTDDLTFDIVKAGTLIKPAVGATKTAPDYTIFIIVGAILLLIIVIVIIVIMVNRRRPNKQNPKKGDEDNIIHLKLHSK